MSRHRFRVSQLSRGDTTGVGSVSAVIEEEHMEQALGAFEKVGRDPELI